MWFSGLDAVRLLAGADYETAVVPPKARSLLSCPHLQWNQRPVAAYTAPRNGFSDDRSKPATIAWSHEKAKVTQGHEQGTST
jgi:hypothetical protein